MDQWSRWERTSCQHLPATFWLFRLRSVNWICFRYIWWQQARQIWIRKHAGSSYSFQCIMNSYVRVMGIWLESHYHWKTPGWSTCKLAVCSCLSWRGWNRSFLWDSHGLKMGRLKHQESFQKTVPSDMKKTNPNSCTESRLDTFLLQFYDLWPLNPSACNATIISSYHLRVQSTINYWLADSPRCRPWAKT